MQGTTGVVLVIAIDRVFINWYCHFFVLACLASTHMQCMAAPFGSAQMLCDACHGTVCSC